MSRSPDPTPELIAVASGAFAAGCTVDDVAHALMQATDSPILAIKALRIAQPELGLADAKHAIDRHLSPQALQAREDMLDQFEQALREPD